MSESSTLSTSSAKVVNDEDDQCSILRSVPLEALFQ